MNACESYNLLLCIDMSVDRLVYKCSLCVLDTVCEFDLFLTCLCPLLLATVFTRSFTLSGGDSKCILYSNRITKLYIPKTYSTANNIYTVAYTTSDTLSSVIYSIDERERSCASHVYTLYCIKEY